MAKIFYKKLLHRFHNNFIISSVENQKIPLCFVIEHMGKKLGQCAVCSQCLEKGGLESGSPHQNIDGNAVIKNTHAVSGVRRDNAHISLLQSMRNPLDGGLYRAVLNAHNYKKFMLMGKGWSVAVVLGKHNISCKILE